MFYSSSMSNLIFRIWNPSRIGTAQRTLSFLSKSLLQVGGFSTDKLANHATATCSALFQDAFVRSFRSTASLNSKITINFIDRHGKKHEAEATVGDSLLDVIIDNDFNFETYGVCEGTISCSTCHVILDSDTCAELEDPLMDELDMLDLACGLTETSRLGCQVYVTKEMDGITVELPKEITDAREL